MGQANYKSPRGQWCRIMDNVRITAYVHDK
jgi:hypothetical protein